MAIPGCPLLLHDLSGQSVVLRRPGRQGLCRVRIWCADDRAAGAHGDQSIQLRLGHSLGAIDADFASGPACRSHYRARWPLTDRSRLRRLRLGRSPFNWNQTSRVQESRDDPWNEISAGRQWPSWACSRERPTPTTSAWFEPTARPPQPSKAGPAPAANALPVAGHQRPKRGPWPSPTGGESGVVAGDGNATTGTPAGLACDGCLRAILAYNPAAGFRASRDHSRSTGTRSGITSIGRPNGTESPAGV